LLFQIINTFQKYTTEQHYFIKQNQFSTLKMEKSCWV